jgi:endonuclease YncB( thermonuclease family)
MNPRTRYWIAHWLDALTWPASLVLKGIRTMARTVGRVIRRRAYGDTIRIYHQKPDVRLVGFNAPETRRAQCEAERELGAAATRRLRELLRHNHLDFALIECSCRQGTAGTMACNWGRRCGTLKVDGRDVGDILIAEHLAVPFVCGKTSCPKTPRPWCD